MRVHINSYYRNLLSSFTVGSDSYSNILLLRELNEGFPKLVKEALTLITDKKIAKVSMTSYDFHENVLVRETMFTCKHELAAIFLEYMYNEQDQEEKDMPSKEELEESDYLEKMYNILNPG